MERVVNAGKQVTDSWQARENNKPIISAVEHGTDGKREKTRKQLQMRGPIQATNSKRTSPSHRSTAFTFSPLV